MLDAIELDGRFWVFSAQISSRTVKKLDNFPKLQKTRSKSERMTTATTEEEILKIFVREVRNESPIKKSRGSLLTPVQLLYNMQLRQVYEPDINLNESLYSARVSTNVY